MASERLQVILDMETGAYRREARKASDATREIGSSAQQTDTKMKTLETSFKRIGVAAVAGLGAAAGAFVGSTLRSASDLTESMNAVEKTFEDGADAVLNFGEQAATSAGLARSEFNQLVVPIGALLRNFGLGAQEAAQQAIALTQRAADLASVFNVDVSEALTAVQAALRGEGDPIERFGANVSAARVEAYALAEGLVETKGEIDDNVKVMARLGLIFQDTERFAGDFADTAGEAANQVRTLAAEWEDFKASVGTELLGPASDVLTFAGRGVSALGTLWNTITTPLDEVQRTLKQIPLSVSRLRREVGGFEGQEGAAFLQLLSNIPRQALESTDVIEGFADAVDLTSEDLEELLDQLGDTGSWDDYADAASRLADIMNITEDEAAALLPILRLLEDQLASQQGIDAYGDRLTALAGYYGETAVAARDAAGANDELANSFLGVLTARRELLSPIFAAAQSQQRKSEAREAVEEARTGDFDTEAERVEAVSRAELDLLEATLEADVATEEYARTFRAGFEDAEELAEGLNVDLLEILRTLGLLNDLAPVDLQIILGLTGPLGGIFIPENDPRNFPRPDRRVSTIPTGRASGGPMDPLRPYTVGENGIEVVVPNVPSHVIPNHQLGGIGGTAITNYVSVAIDGATYGGDPAAFAKGIAREMDRALVDLRGGRV